MQNTTSTFAVFSALCLSEAISQSLRQLFRPWVSHAGTLPSLVYEENLVSQEYAWEPAKKTNKNILHCCLKICYSQFLHTANILELILITSTCCSSCILLVLHHPAVGILPAVVARTWSFIPFLWASPFLFLLLFFFFPHSEGYLCKCDMQLQ